MEMKKCQTIHKYFGPLLCLLYDMDSIQLALLRDYVAEEVRRRDAGGDDDDDDRAGSWSVTVEVMEWPHGEVDARVGLVYLGDDDDTGECDGSCAHDQAAAPVSPVTVPVAGGGTDTGPITSAAAARRRRRFRQADDAEAAPDASRRAGAAGCGD
jgi:hypothetical protein